MKYPAMIQWEEEDQVYTVEFPDLPGCLTYGETLEEAQDMAKDALTGYLESMDSRKMKVIKPSDLLGKEIYYIEPDKNVGFAIWLKTTREELGMTQKELADKLEIRYQTYQRFEAPSTSNPRLSTIIRLEKVLKRNILIVDGC